MWVISIVFRAGGLPRETLVAAAYSNGRRDIDYILFWGLSKHTIFPAVFLSEEFQECASVTRSRSPVQRDEVRHIIEAVIRSLTARRLSCGFDPDHEAALAELQNHSPLKNLAE